MNGSSIIVKNVSVTLQKKEVLANISFALGAGEHLAIIGSSGSGKTMLAKVLAGQVFVKGSVVFQFDEPSSLQKKVLLIEQRYGFKNLSHTTDFYYQQRYNSFDNSDAKTVLDELKAICQPDDFRIESLLLQFGLQHRYNAPLIQLSSGEHKRFQLVKAMLSQPQILILDSPFTGLDAAMRKEVYKVMNELAANDTKIIVITEANQIPACITHIALLDEGRLKNFISKADFNNDVSPLSGYQYSHISKIGFSKSEPPYEYAVNMRNVTIAYGGKTILHNINWQVKTGDKWLLRGLNGAGKSTLISLINGDNPQAYKNEIYLFDKRRGTGESIWDIKQKIGFVSPELHQFYDKGTSCYNTIASGFFDTIGLFKKLSQQQHEQLKQWIDFLNFSAIQNKSLATLSFGIQRLILLARAMVKNPPLLILDEPCQGLDEEQKNSFVNLVNNICEQFNKTLIYVSHYDNEIPDCIEKVIELKAGEQKIYSIKKKEFVTV